MDSKSLAEGLFKYLDDNNINMFYDSCYNTYRFISKPTTLPGKIMNALSPSSEWNSCDLLINLCGLRDGNRILINSYMDSPDKICGFLDDADVIHSDPDGRINLPESIYVYPNADKELLRLQAQPTDCNIQLIQGEYAVTRASDENPILSTFGIATCVGLLLYDPLLHLGSVAHIDFKGQISETFGKMIRALDDRGAGELEFRRTSNLNPVIERYHIMRKYGDRFLDVFELPRHFSFDTRIGIVGDYVQSYDSTFDVRLGEKTNHRIEQLITPCFPVYMAR